MATKTMEQVHELQFGTSSPSCETLCAFCGQQYGEHWGIICPQPSPRGPFGHPALRSNREIDSQTRLEHKTSVNQWKLTTSRGATGVTYAVVRERPDLGCEEEFWSLIVHFRRSRFYRADGNAFRQAAQEQLRQLSLAQGQKEEAR